MHSALADPVSAWRSFLSSGSAPMGRHNDVRKALDGARIPDKHDKAMRLLLAKATFDHAELPDDRYALSVATLSRRLHVSEDTTRRILMALAENGWLKRYETDQPGRIAGVLLAGSDFGYRNGGVCKVCGGPLPSPRSKTCSTRCRKALSRMNCDKAQVSRGVVTFPAVEIEEPPTTRTKCDDVTFPAGHVTQPSVTNPRSEGVSAEEASKEEVGEEEPAMDLAPVGRVHRSYGFEWPPGSIGEWENRRQQ